MRGRLDHGGLCFLFSWKDALMQYGGFWIRVGAYLIDYIVLTIAQYALLGVFGVSLYGVSSMDLGFEGWLEDIGSVILVLAILVGNVLYFVIMESSAKQATLGKMALGLVVTDLSGNRITFLRALGRYFAKILSGAILAIGYIMVAFTDNNQGLHDMLCSTYVVKGHPDEVGVDTSVFE